MGVVAKNYKALTPVASRGPDAGDHLFPALRASDARLTIDDGSGWRSEPPGPAVGSGPIPRAGIAA